METGGRAKVCIVWRPVHLPGMRGDERNLRLRVTRREEPDLGTLIEWVLGIAEARHRAWVNGESTYIFHPDDPFRHGIPSNI